MTERKCLMVGGVGGVAAAAGLAFSCLPALAQDASLDRGRAYAAELMGDALSRTSAPAQPQKFPVNVKGQIQFRYLANFRDEPPADDEDVTIGFQTRRTKIEVSGKVIDDSWGYKIVGAFSRSSGAFGLEDAFVTRAFDGGWQAMFGQFKLPLLREENISSSKQLPADRSPMNSVFSQGRSQGIELSNQGEAARIQLAFSDGIGTANTDFTSTSEADFGLTGRAEWKWAGEWRQFGEFTSFQGRPFGGMVGVAGHWQSGGETGGPTADVDLAIATVDLSVVGSGWNAYAAGVWRNVDSMGVDFNDFGALIQGGVFVAPQSEVFARWDSVFPDDDRSTDSDFHTITGGLNYYIVPESHAAKFTLDAQVFLDSPAESIVSPSTGFGLLPDAGDGQVAIRAQFQLLF